MFVTVKLIFKINQFMKFNTIDLNSNARNIKKRENESGQEMFNTQIICWWSYVYQIVYVYKFFTVCFPINFRELDETDVSCARGFMIEEQMWRK